MDKGHFYYLDDRYFIDFPDPHLIQNMCPVTAAYIVNEYIDKRTNVPVRVDGVFEKELLDKAKRVLALQRKGVPLIFPDVLAIEARLLDKA